ncbi:hypothetical protein AAMO2058_001298600 [Amorphochlora amoebiformis]
MTTRQEPSIAGRLRVLFEDGWDYGKVVKVGEKKDNEGAPTWQITVRFDGEGEDDEEIYTYPDEDVVLARDEELVLSSIQKRDFKTLEALIKLTPYLRESQDPLEGFSAAQLACLSSESKLLRILLENKLNPNLKSHAGEPLVHLACSARETKNLRTLIEFSADISIQDSRGRSVLHCAAASGDPNVLNALLKPQVDTLRFFATVCGSTKEVAHDPTLFLDLDSPEGWEEWDDDDEEETNRDNKRKDEEKREMKEEEQKKESKDIKLEEDKVTVVVKPRKPMEGMQEETRGNNAKKKRKKVWKGSKRGALHTAILHGNLDFAKRLCAAGANIDLQDKNQRTPLHLACLKGDVSAAKALIDLGANIHIIDKNGHTPFITAAASGKLDIVSMFCDRRGDEWHLVVNRPDNKGLSALSHACKRKDTKMTSILLKSSANPNTKDMGRMTPLHTAVASGDRKIVKILLNSDTRIGIADVCYWYHVIEPLGARFFTAPDFNKPKEPRQGAQFGDFLHAIERKGDWLKLSNGYWVPRVTYPRSDPKDTKYAFPESRPEPIVDSFLHHFSHLNPNPTQIEEAPPTKKDYSGLSGFIQLRVNPNATDILKRTALHTAAVAGNFTVGIALLDGKANINARDSDGITPLYLAANEGKEEFVKMILNRGADYRIPREDGWTPLHVASAFAKLEIVKLLLNAGANPRSRDKYGSIPLAVLEGPWRGRDENAERVAEVLKSAMKCT